MSIKTPPKECYSECFGCQWRFGKPSDPEREPEMAQLWECYQQNQGKMSNEHLCKIMSRIQVQLFVMPYLRLAGKPPTWTPQEIKRHLHRYSLL
jgi:hypothetical protein